MQQRVSLDDILVSVVVPVYNVEKFLPQCVDSLLAQTHPNLEIILVDDGSTDGSGNICDSYAAGNGNVRVIHQKNAGLSAARNTGIAAAKGEYIGFVDSDDFVAPQMYQSLLEAALTHQMSVAVCGRYITDEDGNVTQEAFAPPEAKTYSPAAAMEQILIGGPVDVAAWDKLYRKELFDGIQFPVGEINEDAAIVFHLMARTQGLVHIGAPMYYYRQRGGSITKSGYKPNKFQALEHAQAIEAFVCGQFPGLETSYRKYTAYLCCQLLSLMLKDPQARKQYPEHYRLYLEGLRKNMWFLYTNKNVGLMWKIRGTVAGLGLYEILYRVLKK